MLRALHISNFAVIEEAEFEGEKGLTVFTGETGAGKSILIDALGLLLGGRADADHVRAGCEEAVVEGIFTAIPTLKTRLGERGCPDLGDEVHVRRIIGRNGRGKAYVNGSLVTVGVLASLMRGLIDVAGQHEHTRLLDPTSHGEILDRVGGLENLIGAYRADFDALRGVEVEMTALGGDERQVQGRVDFLRFQLEEFERLGVDPEADAGLEDERRKLLSVEKLRRAANEAEFTVASEEGSAVERVGKALSWLSDAAKLDASLQPLAQSLRTALVELEEAGRSLSRYVASAEGDPQRLSEVEERLNALKHLCRKHATDVAGLRTRHAELTDELQRLENREGAVALLSARRLSLETTARASAARLSAARADAARRLTTAVKSGLAGLALGKSCFEVRLTAQETLTASGLDAVEFYFNANPGEPLKPLAKVASGGEASRVLLALKKAVAGSDACGCYVLDEADAGVGGAVAEVVGRMVKDLSRHCQVLCITHSPQVAAYADAHWVVSKIQRAGRTVSRVSHMASENERTRELARMLSGVELTREALGAAEALVRSARRSGKTSKLQTLPLREERPQTSWTDAVQVAEA